MHRSIDYYFSLVSPWAYIGHATFMIGHSNARAFARKQPGNVSSKHGRRTGDEITPQTHALFLL
jgi:hypothetical protein